MWGGPSSETNSRETWVMSASQKSVSPHLKNPVFVALDVDDEMRALSLVEQLHEHVGGFKIGPRLCLRYGPSFIKKVAGYAPVFVDNKYFDIPSTMAAAIEATFHSGASFATVHAQSGAKALKELARLEQQFNQERFFRILAVTILTSFTQEELPPNSRQIKIAQQVSDLAALVHSCGLKGLVCSPEEVKTLRSQLPDSYLVVPGVRLAGVADGDQVRVASPEATLADGASALVVGRPIIEAKDPVAQAKLFCGFPSS